MARPRIGDSPGAFMNDSPAVIAAESFIKAPGESPILGRAISHLVASPVVETDWDHYLLVNIEWFNDALGEYIDNVIVAVGAIVEVGSERTLPFLCLERATRIGCVEDEPFEVQFAHAADFRSSFEIQIEKVAYAVGTFEEPHLWVEIRTDLAMTGKQVQPIALITEACTKVGLGSGKIGCACLGGEAIQHQISYQHKASIQAPSLVKAVSNTTGALVDPHRPEVGAAGQGTLQPHHRIVGIRIGAGVARFHVHDSQIKASQ